MNKGAKRCCAVFAFGLGFSIIKLTLPPRYKVILNRSESGGGETLCFVSKTAAS